MYVYKVLQSNLFTVGHYDNNNCWFPESDHSDKESAAAKVSYLNGGAFPKKNIYDKKDNS